MNYEYEPGRNALHLAWTAIRVDRPDDALRYYQEAISVARADTVELRTGLLGAAAILALRDDRDEAKAYLAAYNETAPPAPHPKYQQLYIPVNDLMQLWYLRKHEVWASTPGKFNPKKRIKADQGRIVATVWRKETGYWVATTYWLKSYDPPFAWNVYHGGDSCPCEARTPMEVLAATGGIEIPKFLEAIP